MWVLPRASVVSLTAPCGVCANTSKMCNPALTGSSTEKRPIQVGDSVVIAKDSFTRPGHCGIVTDVFEHSVGVEFGDGMPEDWKLTEIEWYGNIR